MANVYAVVHTVMYEGDGLVSIHSSQIGAALSAQSYAKKSAGSRSLAEEWGPDGITWTWSDSTVHIMEMAVLR